MSRVGVNPKHEGRLEIVVRYSPNMESQEVNAARFNEQVMPTVSAVGGCICVMGRVLCPFSVKLN